MTEASSTSSPTEPVMNLVGSGGVEIEAQALANFIAERLLASQKVRENDGD